MWWKSSVAILPWNVTSCDVNIFIFETVPCSLCLGNTCAGVLLSVSCVRREVNVCMCEWVAASFRSRYGMLHCGHLYKSVTDCLLRASCCSKHASFETEVSCQQTSSLHWSCPLNLHMSFQLIPNNWIMKSLVVVNWLCLLLLKHELLTKTCQTDSQYKVWKLCSFSVSLIPGITACAIKATWTVHVAVSWSCCPQLY